MTLIQACPDYVSTIGAYVPPLFVTGVFVIFIGAVGGRAVIQNMYSAKMKYGSNLTQNWLLYLTTGITVILSVITAWVVLSYPPNCYRWLLI